MTAEDRGCEINIHVVSELMEKIFLNIPADWLNRSVGTVSWIVVEILWAAKFSKYSATEWISHLENKIP